MLSAAFDCLMCTMDTLLLDERHGEDLTLLCCPRYIKMLGSAESPLSSGGRAV